MHHPTSHPWRRSACIALAAVCLAVSAPGWAARPSRDKGPIGKDAPASPPTQAGSKPPPARAGDAAVVDQFLMLAFDADPASGTPSRTQLARWLDGVHLLIAGDPAAQASVARAISALGPLSGVPIAIAADGRPNALVAVLPDLGDAFAGPLRQFLELAFAGDETAVGVFLQAIVALQPCWVLPVWADTERTVIKAAVIGVDARIGHPAIDRCVMRGMAAALGLLGANGYLPKSIFNPRTSALLPSYEDRLMLRLLYAPALRVGMTRDEAAAAARAVLPALRGH